MMPVSIIKCNDAAMTRHVHLKIMRATLTAYNL